MKAKPVNILLIEDNEGDVVLTREALTECKVRNNLYVVNNGAAALNFLYRNYPYEDAVGQI